MNVPLIEDTLATLKALSTCLDEEYSLINEKEFDPNQLITLTDSKKNLINTLNGLDRLRQEQTDIVPEQWIPAKEVATSVEEKLKRNALQIHIRFDQNQKMLSLLLTGVENSSLYDEKGQTSIPSNNNSSVQSKA